MTFERIEIGPDVVLYRGDCREVLPTLPDASVNCCVTSPPYFGLRDYGVDGQIGLEQTPDAYVSEMVSVLREARRVLKDDGTLWLNLGDSYAGSGNGWQKEGSSIPREWLKDGRPGNGQGRPPAYISSRQENGLKPKDLIGIPWRVALALQADGWYLRSDIIWAKPNCMPESVTDRPTRSHEYIFLLSKSARYYYDHEAIKEPAIYAAPAADANASTLSGAAHGRHVLGDAIPAAARRTDKRLVDGFVPKSDNGKHPVTDKRRGHTRRHAGFNDRWDKMEKHEQCSGMRNKRDVWTIAPAQFHDAHFATFPPALIEPCIKAGCPSGGIVLDPFNGAGTSGLCAAQLGCGYIGIELNPRYIELSKKRIEAEVAQRKLFV